MGFARDGISTGWDSHGMGLARDGIRTGGSGKSVAIPAQVDTAVYVYRDTADPCSRPAGTTCESTQHSRVAVGSACDAGYEAHCHHTNLPTEETHQLVVIMEGGGGAAIFGRELPSLGVRCQAGYLGTSRIYCS